jgi:hypothetical protein
MSVISDIKTSAQVLLEAHKIPEYTKLLEVMSQVIELQEDLSITKEQLREARATLAAIDNDLAVIEKLTRVVDVLKSEDGYWYCVNCAIVDKRLGPLVVVRNAKGAATTQCTRCKQTYMRLIHL